MMFRIGHSTPPRAFSAQLQAIQRDLHDGGTRDVLKPIVQSAWHRTWQMATDVQREMKNRENQASQLLGAWGAHAPQLRDDIPVLEEHQRRRIGHQVSTVVLVTTELVAGYILGYGTFAVSRLQAILLSMFVGVVLWVIGTCVWHFWIVDEDAHDRPRMTERRLRALVKPTITLLALLVGELLILRVGIFPADVIEVGTRIGLGGLTIVSPFAAGILWPAAGLYGRLGRLRTEYRRLRDVMREVDEVRARLETDYRGEEGWLPEPEAATPEATSSTTLMPTSLDGPARRRTASPLKTPDTLTSIALMLAIPTAASAQSINVTVFQDITASSDTAVARGVGVAMATALLADPDVSRVEWIQFSDNGWDAPPIASIALPRLELPTCEQARVLTREGQRDNEERCAEVLRAARADHEASKAAILKELTRFASIPSFVRDRCTAFWDVVRRGGARTGTSRVVIISDAEETCGAVPSKLTPPAVAHSMSLVLVSLADNGSETPGQRFQQARESVAQIAPWMDIVHPDAVPTLMDGGAELELRW